MSTTIGATLRAHRTARGLSLLRAGNLAGLSGTIVHRIETGERNATRDTLTWLASAYALTDTERDALFLRAGLIPPGVDDALLLDALAAARRKEAA